MASSTELKEETYLLIAGFFLAWFCISITSSEDIESGFSPGSKFFNLSASLPAFIVSACFFVVAACSSFCC